MGNAISFARGAATNYKSTIANYSGCIYFDTTNKKIMLNGVTYGVSSYNDLSNKPTIPSDSNLVHTTGDEEIGGEKNFRDLTVFEEGLVAREVFADERVKLRGFADIYFESNDDSDDNAQIWTEYNNNCLRIGMHNGDACKLRGVDNPENRYDAVNLQYLKDYCSFYTRTDDIGEHAGTISN